MGFDFGKERGDFGGQGGEEGGLGGLEGGFGEELEMLGDDQHCESWQLGNPAVITSANGELKPDRRRDCKNIPVLSVAPSLGVGSH